MEKINYKNFILGIIIVGIIILFLIFIFVPQFFNPCVKGDYIVYDVSAKDGKYLLTKNILTEQEEKLIASNKSIPIKDIISLKQSSFSTQIAPEIVAKKGTFIIFFDYPKEHPMYISSESVGMNTSRIDDNRYLSYEKINFGGKSRDIMIWQVNDDHPSVFYECEIHRSMGNSIKIL